LETFGKMHLGCAAAWEAHGTFDEAIFITGVALPVNGGALVRVG
jgi:hypothetical protein